MEKEITISREWLEILLAKSRRVSGAQQPEREAYTANLLGYIESANYLLKQHI